MIVPSCGCCAPWGQRCPSSKSGDPLVSLGMRDPLTATGRICTSPEHSSHTQSVVVVPSIHFPHFIHFWPKLSCPVAIHQLRGPLVVRAIALSLSKLHPLVRGTPGVSPRQPGHIGVGDNPPVFLAGVFDEIPLLLVGISCSGHLLEWDTPGGDNSWIFNPECIQPVLSRTEGTTKHCPSQTESVRSPGHPGLFHFTALQPNSQRRVLSRVYTSTFSFNLFLTQPHPCPVYSQHTGRTAYMASTR